MTKQTPDGSQWVDDIQISSTIPSGLRCLPESFFRLKKRIPVDTSGCLLTSLVRAALAPLKKSRLSAT